QIRELLTNYGKVDMLGLDMYLPEFCWPDIKETVMMARQLQPDVLMRKRGIGVYGDYMTPERWVPSSPDTSDKRVDRPWMVIDTLADIFAYEPDGSKYKSGEWIVSNLIDIVAKGGNFMVSIGPDPNGHFHPEAVRQLEYAGDWLKVNGEAIYGTRPWVKYKEGEDVRFTRRKDNRYVYAISLKWPGDKFTSKLVRPRKKSKIIMLGDKGWFGNPKKLRWSFDEKEGLFIEIPERLEKEKNRPCKQAYVFKIEQFLDKNE
ncbi:MAG: alpha-L-fucosidase, partial [Planctomycetota bacterium]